jgi:hypothetical protein
MVRRETFVMVTISTAAPPRFPMRTATRHLLRVALITTVAQPLSLGAQQGGSPFPGGENPDGSLRPSARLARLFTQDSYTEYTLLEPGTDQFRIRFLTEQTRAGATEIVNATRGGSEGTDVEVYDPRTGKPLPFTYQEQGDGHAIRAQLAMPVPPGGIGRVIIYKTYHDFRSYQVYGDANPAFGIEPGDITWVRSLSGYRLGVILPAGYAFLSSNVAAHLSTTPDGRVGLHFANPSGLANPLTVHARRTTAKFASRPYTDVFFDDAKTLYDLGSPDRHEMRLEHIYTEYRKGARPPIELLAYAPLALSDLKVLDLDTAKPLATSTNAAGTTVALDVPIVDDRQSAHLEVTGRLTDPAYRIVDGTLVFDRTVKGLRNTILLPAGWDVAAVSQAATIGMFEGRVFVALINLNAENEYRVVIRANRR